MEIADNSTTKDNNNYKSLCDDLEALLNVVDNYVKIVAIKNCTFTGFIHSIDPITHSIILSAPQGDIFQTVLIPGHAILDVTKEPKPQDVRQPTEKKTVYHSPEDLLKRKIKLMDWLRLNLLPVSELDDKIIIGNATILPPYDNLDLCTDNPIVSMQIQKIMECMPED